MIAAGRESTLNSANPSINVLLIGNSTGGMICIAGRRPKGRDH